MDYDLIIDWPGAYGGPSSRDELLRALKEALALVEYTPGDTELSCAGIRIEVTRTGSPREE